jgi:hypothetical protein
MLGTACYKSQTDAMPRDGRRIGSRYGSLGDAKAPRQKPVASEGPACAGLDGAGTKGSSEMPARFGSAGGCAGAAAGASSGAPGAAATG